MVIELSIPTEYNESSHSLAKILMVIERDSLPSEPAISHSLAKILMVIELTADAYSADVGS